MKFSKPIIMNKEIKENIKDKSEVIVDSVPVDKLSGRDLGDIDGMQDEVMTFDYENLVWKTGDKLNFVCNIVSEYQNIIKDYPEE